MCVYYVPHVVLNALHVLTYILLWTTLEIATIITNTLHMRHLEPREVKNLPQMTQLARCRPRIPTQVSESAMTNGLQYCGPPQTASFITLLWCRPDAFLHVHVHRQTYKILVN